MRRRRASGPARPIDLLRRFVTPFDRFLHFHGTASKIHGDLAMRKPRRTRRPFWKRLLGRSGRPGVESKRFAPYQVVRLLHEGQKTRLYLARSPEDDSLVAIKSFKPLYNRTARRIRRRHRIRTEGEIGFLLNPSDGHRAWAWPIVRTLGYGHEFDDPGRCYYVVLEYIEGVNLKRLLASGEPLSDALRLRIARAVARGLAVIHDRNFIHRDVCADNVLLAGRRRPKLIDLGFVAPVGVAYPEKSGTPSYMSPEQFAGKPLGPTCDIYGYGVLLYELYTGRMPFTSRYPPGKRKVAMRRLSELMTKHLKDPPPRPSEVAPDVPPKIEEIILRCLEKDPAMRYQSMTEILRALARVRVGPAPTADPSVQSRRR